LRYGALRSISFLTGLFATPPVPQELFIQLGTPSFGSTHFITTA
jgi:hypothetical protein